MMMNTTIEQLRELRLPGMATGLQEQLSQAAMTALSFEERLSLLVEREVHWRNDKRQTRLLKDAKLKYSQASIEDLNTSAGRGLERKAVMSLALGNWIASGHSVLITGATGVGKSWLACALAQYACRRGHSAFYQRVTTSRTGNNVALRVPAEDQVEVAESSLSVGPFSRRAEPWQGRPTGQGHGRPLGRFRRSSGRHGWRRWWW